MADGDRIDVKINVDASNAQQGFEKVKVSAAEFQAALRNAGGNADKAFESLLGIGSGAEKAAEGLGKASAAAEELGGKASGALRELSFIADELIGGRWSRIPGSLSVMANRTGLLATAFRALLTPIGAAVAAVGALSAAFVILGVKAAQAMRSIDAAINTAALAQGTAKATEEYQRFDDQLTRTGVLGWSAGRTLAEALIKIPGLTDRAREGIAGIAEAFTKYQAGGDPEKAAKDLTQIFSSPGSIQKFVEENNLLSQQDEQVWAQASKGAVGALQRQEIAVAALTRRYGAYSAEVKKAQAAQLSAAEMTGMMGGGVVPSTGTFLPPRLNIPPPSQTVYQAAYAQDEANADNLKMPKVKIPKDDFDKWLREVQNADRQAYEAEEQYATAAEQRDRTMLGAFEANMKKLVADKQITNQQAIGFDIQYSDQLFAEEKRRLQQIMADDRLTVEEKTRMWDQIAALGADHSETIAQLEAKAAEQTNKSWTGALKPLEDQFATFATDVIMRTKSIGKAFDDLARQIVEDFLKANIESFLNGLSGGGSGTGGGRGGGGSGGSGGGGLLGSLGSMLGGQAGSLLFGSGGMSGMIGSMLGLGSGGITGAVGTGMQAADVAAMWGGGGAADVAAGMGATSGIASGLAGAGSWIASLLPLLALSKGGIIPSAARGWVVPHFADGGIMSVLHKNEMVLPDHISSFVQNAAANASGSGSGGHTFNINAVDAGSVARLFMSHGSALVHAVNNATRNGSMVRSRT